MSLSIVLSAIVLLLSNTERQVHGFSAPAESLSSFSRWGRARTTPIRLYGTTTTTSPQDVVVDTIGTVTILLPSTDSSTTSIPFGAKSPVGNPTLDEAAAQLANKLTWFSDGGVSTEVVKIGDSADSGLLQVDALIALGLSSNEDLALASTVFERRRQERTVEQKQRQCQFGLDCAEPLATTVGPYDESAIPLQTVLPWTEQATGSRLMDQMRGLFDRWTSDDFGVAMMLFFNQFSGKQVPWVKHSIDATWEKGPVQNAKEFYNMIDKCGDCITKCLADENCKTCIDALNEVDTRDQVASYRTIVSFESELLKDFSYCILQKNNIFECDADVPALPKVEPITSWRGEKLTSKAARSILVGHLDDETAPDGSMKLDISWKVACGANVAYDQFPSQNQIFYESVNGKDMWYDPVFRVETIDGRNVWCKRHYKVRDGATPGTFHFSVLDNGVTSNEFWNIAGVADDLSWLAFHYAGAATSVGQRYLGGLLCTPDGSLPAENKYPEIWQALKSAGIQPWELYIVNNDPQSEGAIEAGPPPLFHFREAVLAAKAKKKAEVA